MLQSQNRSVARYCEDLTTPIFPNKILPNPETPSLKTKNTDLFNPKAPILARPIRSSPFAYLQLPELSASVIGSDDAPGRVLGAAIAFCFRAVLVDGAEGINCALSLSLSLYIYICAYRKIHVRLYIYIYMYVCMLYSIWYMLPGACRICCIEQMCVCVRMSIIWGCRRWMHLLIMFSRLHM